MHTRCPRCQLDFDAVSAWVQCPRCGSPFSAAPPTQQQFIPSTQAVDPAALAQVMRASAPGAPAAPGWSPAPAQAQGQWAPAPQAPNPYPLAYAPPRPGFIADEDLPGRAVVSVILSVVAALGGCNPVGLLGVTVGLMAYSAANDHRVELARSRGRTARGLAWASLAITSVVWVIVVLSLFYELK